MPSPKTLPNRLRGRALTFQDAKQLGLTNNHLRTQQVDHPHWGIWGVDLQIETLRDRCLAYLPRMREGDAFSHVTALELHGVPLSAALDGSDLHVTSQRQSRPRVPGVIGHREKHYRQIDLKGVPVVTPADAWCGLARECDLENLVVLGDTLTTGVRHHLTKPRPWCSLHHLRRAVEQRKSAPGMARAREALGLIRPGAESPQETRLRLLLAREGFTRFEVGVMATDATGQPVLVDGRPVHPDLADEELMIAAEYEGDQHRTDPEQWYRDIDRVRALQAAGWIVIRVTKADLRDPRKLLRDLTAAYAQRRGQRVPVPRY